MAYESDNPQFDLLINNMDSDEVPYHKRRPPLEERLASALTEAGFDDQDTPNILDAIMPVIRRG